MYPVTSTKKCSGGGGIVPFTVFDEMEYSSEVVTGLADQALRVNPSLKTYK